MKTHYILGIAIIVAGAIHLATHSFFGTESYAESLLFDEVSARYRNIPIALNLEVLLLAVTYHTVNGLRVILIEWKQGPRWECGVKWFTISLGIGLVIAGTWTFIQGQGLI